MSLMAFVGVACLGLPDPEFAINVVDCRDACINASRCGLLPSPLGIATGKDPYAIESCLARCRLSESESQFAVRKCLSEQVPIATFQGLWCDASKVCARISSCLRNLRAERELVRRVSVRVFALSKDFTPAPPAVCASNSCGTCLGGPCTADCGDVFVDNAASAWCRDTFATEITPFVEQAGVKRYGATRTCGEALTQAATFDDLYQDRVHVGLRIKSSAEGLLDAGPSAPDKPICRVLRSDEILVLTDTNVAVKVPVAEVFRKKDAFEVVDCDEPKTPPAAGPCDAQAACDAGDAGRTGCDASGGGCADGGDL